MAKKKTTVVDAYRLTYRDARSNKYYEVLITEDGTCILHWGRMHTNGQSSVSAMPSYDDAHDLGMRQVYAKKSKGYIQESASKFVIDSDYVRYAKDGNPDPLFKAISAARATGEYTGVRDAVLIHYADLADKVQALVSRADGQDFEAVSAEYDSLSEIWGEIKDKHAEIEVAMSLAQATLTKKLLGI